MKKRVISRGPATMSGRTPPGARLLKAATCWSLLAAGIVAADDAKAPDLEFLEYLGSWEADESEWVMFAPEVEEESQSGETKESDEPAPDGEKVAELDDEN